MNILVTGANGYIGSHVVKKLLDKGHHVKACDIRFDNTDERAEKTEYNIFDPDPDVFEKTGSPDVCIHLAWRNGFVHNSPTHIEDLPCHFNFLKNMAEGGLKHLVVMGSMHEIGYWEGPIDENTPAAPLSLYGIAKNALRQSAYLIASGHDMCFQWIRGYYITGDDLKNNSIFAKILTAAAEGKKTFPFTSGKNKYDFMSVEELAAQIAAVSLQTEIDGVINCCSGRPISLAERVEAFIKENELDMTLEYGAFPDRKYDSPGVWGDPSKIRRIMNETQEVDK